MGRAYVYALSNLLVFGVTSILLGYILWVCLPWSWSIRVLVGIVMIILNAYAAQHVYSGIVNWVVDRFLPDKDGT